MFCLSRRVCQWTLLVVLALTLMFPRVVYAQGEVPTTPETETQEQETPDGAENPDETPADAPATGEQAGEPGTDTPAVGEQNGEQTVETPVDGEQTIETPATGQESGVQDGVPTPELAPVVEAIADSGAVVTDASGTPLALASEEVADALSDGDPWVVRGGVTYYFMAAGGCAGRANCIESATPVQEAIDFAVDGETVYISGTFTEQISITKNLTLEGVGTAVIQAPDTLATLFTTGAANKPIVFVNNAEVVINNLTVNGLGKGNSNYRFMGIAYYNAGGSILNSTVQGIRNTPANGSQHGNAIYIYNTDGVSRTVVVRGNEVSDFQKNGITANGNNLTAEIVDNTVTGYGEIDFTAQNGIQIGWGAVGHVSNNRVTGFDFTKAGHPDNNASAGILLYQPGAGTVVENNVVSRSDQGIYLGMGSDARISGNNVYGNGTGISLYQASNTQISGNNIHNNTAGSTLYQATGTTITNNRFTGNGTGAWTYLSSGTQIHNNSFRGNDFGLVNYDAGEVVDATDNWWGCAGGPGSSGCDRVVDASGADPVYNNPEGNITFTTILVHDPFAQVDAQDEGQPGEMTLNAWIGGGVPGPQVVHVFVNEAAGPFQLEAGRDTIFNLWDEQPAYGPQSHLLASATLAGVDILPDGSTGFMPLQSSALPAALPQNAEQVGSGFEIKINDAQGKPVEKLSAKMQVDFELPVDFSLPEDKELTVMFYQAETGTWVSLPTTVSGGHVTASADQVGAFVLVLLPRA